MMGHQSGTYKVNLVASPPILVTLPATLAQLGCLLPLADHARLLEEATPTDFRHDSVTLHLLVETPQQGVEGFTIFDDNFGH
jgi:hypothetical protein